MPKTRIGSYYYEGRSEPRVEIKKIRTSHLAYPGIPYTRTELRFKVGGAWRTQAGAVQYLVRRRGMGMAGAGSWLDELAKKVG